MNLMKKTPHVVERLKENRIEYIIEPWKDSCFSFKEIKKIKRFERNLKHILKW